MIEWSDKQRAKDYGIFCREAMLKSCKPICIVSDIRRKTDIQFFRENYPDKLVLIRIKCDDEIRSNRGWIFQSGVDDIQSECNLDDFVGWDHEITNNGDIDAETLLAGILKILS